MNQNLKDKILKMDMEQLQTLIKNSELYSPEALELAKKQIEELDKLEKINSALRAKFEEMTDEEKSQILKDPDLYNKDLVALATAYFKKNADDFSDISEEAKAHLTSLSAEQLMDMLDEKEEMLSERVVLYIKDLIVKKLEGDVKNDPSQETPKTLDVAQTESCDAPVGKVSVDSGHYLGKKYFLKIVYKTIETDVVFKDTELELHQGSGFLKAKNKEKITLNYNDISDVKAKRTISTPSVIFSALALIILLSTEMWDAALGMAIAVLLVLFLGSNGVTRIYHCNGCTYDITTDFKSDALEAKEKIDTAIAQYNGKTNHSSEK